MVSLALGFTDKNGTYYRHALVLAASVLRNISRPLRLHIVSDETLTEEAKGRFRELFTHHPGEVIFHQAVTIPDEVDGKISSVLSRGTVYKLMLPQILDEDKVIYLDCDIVCEADLATLFDLDIGDHFLGVVRFGRERLTSMVKERGLDPDRYFNAGVLVINLAKFRREMPDLLQRAFAIIQASDGDIGDQKPQNILFNRMPDGLYFLPEHFNLRVWQKDHSLLPPEAYRGAIIHFAGKKPWQEMTTASMHYWKYYARLFPEDDVFSRLATLPLFENDHLCRLVLRTPWLRSLVKRIHALTGSRLSSGPSWLSHPGHSQKMDAESDIAPAGSQHSEDGADPQSESGKKAAA